MKKQMIVVMTLCIASGLFVISARKRGGQRDLTIVNDLPEAVRIEVKEKGISQELAPGNKWSGGQGFFIIMMADRPGRYEITYMFPRPKGKPVRLSINEIMTAATQESFDDYDYYTEKGMIEDVEILYEAIPIGAESIY